MRIAIIGLPQSGKTTLFDLVTGRQEEPGAYAAPGSLQVGVAHVLDPRVAGISEIEKPKKTTYAGIEFVDLAGLFATERPDPDSAEALRDADGLLKVLRAFEDPNVPPHKGVVDPRRDLEEISADLFIADLDILERRIERLQASVKKPTPRQEAEKIELALLERCDAHLHAAGALDGLSVTEEEEKTLNCFRFLSQKPSAIVVNIGEKHIGDGAALDAFRQRREPVLAVAAATEKELLTLEPAERGPFLQDLGLADLSGQKVVRAVLTALDHITFFTGGDKEVRAWLIPRGTTAVGAAHSVHSDIARGFIRAEVIAADDFIALGGWKECKARGKEHLEGKDYVVQDGDVINVRFSV